MLLPSITTLGLLLGGAGAEAGTLAVLGLQATLLTAAVSFSFACIERI
jgi:hypothetical protein